MSESVRDAEPGVLGDILGLLAHDVRNPLAALSSNVGFLGMISDDLTEDAREAIEDIQLSMEVLGRIADTMEVLSRVELTEDEILDVVERCNGCIAWGGHINLSPKGIDGFKVLSENRVGYMDFIGSGNDGRGALSAVRSCSP